MGVVRDKCLRHPTLQEKKKIKVAPNKGDDDTQEDDDSDDSDRLRVKTKSSAGSRKPETPPTIKATWTMRFLLVRSVFRSFVHFLVRSKKFKKQIASLQKSSKSELSSQFFGCLKIFRFFYFS